MKKSFIFRSDTFCPLFRIRVSMRNRYPVRIGYIQPSAIMTAPQQNPQELPQIVEPEHEVLPQAPAYQAAMPERNMI